jgi:hypothetical protein
MKKIRGNSSFTGNLAAISVAWRSCRVRRPSACARNACPTLVPNRFRLDQQGHETLNLFQLYAEARVAKRLLARSSGPQFQIERAQFLAQLPVHQLQLLPDARDRHIQTQAGFDADDHEIERIGERGQNIALPALNPALQPEIGSIPACEGGGHAEDQRKERRCVGQ